MNREQKCLSDLIIHYLTKDSKTTDARRKEFNQAIFSKDTGHQVFCHTDLDMVMEKVNRAIKEFIT